MLAFIASPLARWAGGFAILCLVFAAYTAAIIDHTKKTTAAKVETRIITRLVKETGKETERRVEVLKTVQVRSAADVKKLAEQATRIAALQDEVFRASQAHNADSCLSASAVMRLAAVR